MGLWKCFITPLKWVHCPIRLKTVVPSTSLPFFNPPVPDQIIIPWTAILNAWSREVVISRVLRQVSSALDHFKVKSTSCQRFKEHNEVTSLSLYRFVSNFSLYFSRALRLWLVEGDSLSWIFFSVYRDVWSICAFCDVSSICVFAKCKLCCVWFLFATNFELISLSWSCKERIFAWWNSRSWLVVACVSNWLCPSVELMRFATLCLYTPCCVY